MTLSPHFSIKKKRICLMGQISDPKNWLLISFKSKGFMVKTLKSGALAHELYFSIGNGKCHPN